MIDEELYQQAADELNSERRRSDVWARACVLSKNDHDEARYLYTNLRVEELLAEREAGMDGSEHLNVTQHDDTISLDLTGDIEHAGVKLGDAGDFTADTTLSISEMNAIREGTNFDAHDDTLLDDSDAEELTQGTLDDTLASASQRVDFENRFDGHDLGADDTHISAIERDYFQQNPDQLKDRAAESVKSAVERNNEELDVLLDGVHSAQANFDDEDHALTADFTDATELQSIALEEDLEWLENDPTVDSSGTGLQRVSPAITVRSQDETDRLTQELLRQADELPGQHSDIVSTTESDDPGWEPSAKANVAAVGTAAAIGAARYGEQKGSGSSAESNRHSQYPLNLTDGKSKTKYRVFQRDSQVQAVKKGVSWSALFFTLPFLIYRQLFGTAIVYTIMALIIGAGLFVAGLTWLDAGAAASDWVKIATGGFAFLAVVGLLYLPFRHANLWRCEKLEKRGFELIANVKAKNPGKAISRARRASALD